MFHREVRRKDSALPQTALPILDCMQSDNAKRNSLSSNLEVFGENFRLILAALGIPKCRVCIL